MDGRCLSWLLNHWAAFHRGRMKNKTCQRAEELLASQQPTCTSVVATSWKDSPQTVDPGQVYLLKDTDNVPAVSEGPCEVRRESHPHKFSRCPLSAVQVFFLNQRLLYEANNLNPERIHVPNPTAQSINSYLDLS